MNMTRKLDRVKQWAGEKMGQDAKTGVSDEFKALEMEMNLRYDGMEKLHKSMTLFVKSISKREELDGREKMLPVAHLGQTMAHHGEDFEPDSEFGNCLISMGRANDRLARIQETFVASATSDWLESLERSLAMMKEYQAARKKLEQRRLAYDASLTKMQKAKREDFRSEEELRSQKAKYEESSEDVLRRMQDIKEAEADSVEDLGKFLDSELEYHDKCREELAKLRREWPAGASREPKRSQPRSRSNTAHTYIERVRSHEEAEVEPPRPSIRSTGHIHTARHDYADSPPRPTISRHSTFQGPTSVARETPSRMNSTSSVTLTADPGSLRAGLRPTSRMVVSTGGASVFYDPSDESTLDSNSPDRSYGDRSVSPASSHGSLVSRTNSYSTAGASGRKNPPPPPPSRATKPPPPPLKRAGLSSTNTGQY